jgi:S-adenosylmethionine decarboxylase proenzyme
MMAPSASPALAGHHLTADLSGCEASQAWMQDSDALRDACLRHVAAVGLTAVADRFHRFPPRQVGEPAGVTGVVLLAESHLAVHTWPEQGVVTLDVFVCNLVGDNRARAHALIDGLIEGFRPRGIHRQAVRREIPDASATA